MALILAGRNDTATSALPHAPVVIAEAKRCEARWNGLRGKIATVLHRMAWVIEPEPQRDS